MLDSSSLAVPALSVQPRPSKKTEDTFTARTNKTDFLTKRRINVDAQTPDDTTKDIIAKPGIDTKYPVEPRAKVCTVNTRTGISMELFDPRFWFRRHFRLHRVVGLAYIFNWLHVAILLWSVPPATFVELYAPRVILLHCHGLLQTTIAARTFFFLSRKTKQNYFSDRGTISHAFVVENAFFVILSLYAALQAWPPLRALMRQTMVMEAAFVFLPYQTIRPLFPKTSFVQQREKDQQTNKHDRTSDVYAKFMYFSALTTKIAYLIGKHYIGFFVHYACFLDRIPEPNGLDGWLNYVILLGAGYNLTIGVFVHTLKFKKMISPFMAVVLYIPPFIIWIIPASVLLYRLRHLYDIFLLATVGLLINRFGNSQRLTAAWQLGLMACFYAERWGWLELSVTKDTAAMCT